MTPAGNAWPAGVEESRCPVCECEGCEDPSHVAPPEESPAVVAAGPKPATPALRFRHAREVMATPRPAAIIEGVAWKGALSVLVSESGAGKTFLLLSAAAAVSGGMPWAGRAVHSGSVAYLSYEGDALNLRLHALVAHQGHRLEHLHILHATDPLSPVTARGIETTSPGEATATDALRTLVAELEAAKRPPIVLLIIDTVRASLAGSEDSSEHVSAYLRAVRRLLALLPEAGAILSHHAGWQDGESQRKRERGSSAWRGNSDATLYLEAGEVDRQRGETRLVLRALKVRDSEKPVPLHLVRCVVHLLDFGEDATSCVIEADRRSPADREAATAAALDAETRVLDLRTLRAIADRPDLATSQDRLRLLLSTRKAVVGESLGRLVRNGLVNPAPRGRPYEVTPAGREALAGSNA